MTSEKKIEVLKKSFEDIVWMSIRYAHGRQTYAPSMVRDAIKNFKKVFPDWEPKNDITIEPPNKEDFHGFVSKYDYLNDLFLGK